MLRWALLLAAALLLTPGCSGDDGGASSDPGEGEQEDAGVSDTGGEADADLGPADGGQTDEDLGPGPDTGGPTGRFCDGLEWGEAPRTEGKAGAVPGAYEGYYKDLPVGTVESIKVIPEHPFELRTIRVSFAGPAGSARIHLTKAFGRSYPDLPSDTRPGSDLVPPIDLDLSEAPDPEEWIELDVSEHGVILLPGQHYVIASERLTAELGPGVSAVAAGDTGRSQMILPGEDTPYGSDANFRMELQGAYSCEWSAEQRWFGERMDQPFTEDRSQRVAVADLDGDGHDDLILNDGSPFAYLGDGTGSFVAPAVDPFSEAPRASMLVFGDLDNDGDTDAFAATYIAADGDGDGVTVGEGDCDDATAEVHPGAEEVADNGRDDDCDRVADDASDDSDADEDGASVADGDCDDGRADVGPDFPELQDSRDNDCDGQVDEDFPNSVLLNDGAGHFVRVDSSGVEAYDPSAAAALGDTDGDGVLDLYWGNWLKRYPYPDAVPDRFLRGVGDGSFTEATEDAGMVPFMGPAPCYGVLFADYDDDGDQDVWVGNYGYALNYLWTNQGDGTFVDRGYETGIARDSVGTEGGNTFGGDFGDIDNDGDLDLYAANIAHPRYQPWSDPSMLLVNDGGAEPVFTNELEERGMIYDEGDVNAAFADFDNDGDLDLAVGSLYPNHYSRLYANDGSGHFIDVTYEAGVAVHDSVSAVWSDVDEDGDLDLLVSDRRSRPAVEDGEEPPEFTNVHLFINRVGQERSWVMLDLQGTTSNRDGVGARVTLTAGGQTQIREVKGGGGHSNTQSTGWVHFGLDRAEQIDALTVRWMGGATEEFSGAAPRGRYRLVEGSGSAEAIP